MTQSNSRKMDFKNRHISEKSAWIAYVLCLFSGFLGVHRFYVRKFGTGFLMILTLGGFGLWVVVDLVFIINNKFDDKKNKVLVFSQAPSNLKKFFQITVSLLLWFILSIGSLFAFVMYLTQGLVAISNHQLQAIKTGDYQKAYGYTSTHFKQKISLDEFKAFVNQYPELKKYQDTTFMSRYIKNNKYGRIDGYITLNNGKTISAEFNLIKQDGQWKINYFRFNR